MRAGQYRASVSRAYYSAYAAITSELMELPDIVNAFPADRNNPTHAKLRNLVDQLPRRGLRQQDVPSIKRILARLLSGRIEADYVPGRSVGRQDAVDRFRDCEGVLAQLRIGA